MTNNILEKIICTEAFAEDDTEVKTQTKETFSSFIPLILIVGVFYFLVIRPQQKRAREHQRTLDSLSQGNEVVTNGGLFGTVVETQEDTITIEIAPNVTVKCKKTCISEIIESKEVEDKKQKKEKKKSKEEKHKNEK